MCLSRMLAKANIVLVGICYPIMATGLGPIVLVTFLRFTMDAPIIQN